jgi:hypothetical protein
VLFGLVFAGLHGAPGGASLACLKYRQIIGGLK